MTTETQAAETTAIPFHGSALRVKEQGGVVWVAVRPICEHLGVSWSGQNEKLTTDPDFTPRSIRMEASDGKERAVTCLPSKQVMGWLNTINPNKVSADAKPLLYAYRAEVGDVLNEYWADELPQYTNATEEPTTAVIPFHGSALRVAKDGEQVYVAVKPVCEHLGIAPNKQIEKLHSDDDFELIPYRIISTDGKKYEMACLPQEQLLGWLYTINSNRVSEGARKKLKAYRQETTQAINDYWTTGQATRSSAEPVVTMPNFANPAEAARAWADEYEARQQAETERRALSLEVEASRPKVEAYEQFMDCEGLLSVGDVARLLGSMGQNRLFALLRENGVLMDKRKVGIERHNLPYQVYLDAGYFEVKATPSRCGLQMFKTTKVTTKGFEWLRKRFFADAEALDTAS